MESLISGLLFIIMLVLPFFLLLLRNLEKDHKKLVVAILFVFEIALFIFQGKALYEEFMFHIYPILTEGKNAMPNTIKITDPHEVEMLLSGFVKHTILAIFGILLLVVAIIKTILYRKKNEGKGLSTIIRLLIISYYLYNPIIDWLIGPDIWVPYHLDL